MTHQAFDALVRRLEAKYASRPRALKWAVFSWMALGYAGFLGWFGTLIGLGVGALIGGAFAPPSVGWLLILIGAVLLTFAILQITWLASLRPTPPTGRVLRRGEAPAFDELLDDLRHRQRASGFHRVVLTIEFNAGITQVPRLGVFGWSWNELQVGLPLLEALSVEEVRAVLAHEIAHVSDRAGRFGHYTYRLRQTWEALFNSLFSDPQSSNRWDKVLLTKFIEWYWPRFNARAFILSRKFEHLADAQSAAIVGSDVTASALWRIDCVGRLLSEKFWTELWRLSNTQAEPPNDVLSRLIQTMHSARPDDAESEVWIEHLCQSVTDHLDTHPCLASRLESIGHSVGDCREQGLAGPARQPAAAWLLAGAYSEIRKDVEQNWLKETGKTWRDRHARAGLVQHRIDQLHQVVPNVDQNPADLWEKARNLMDLQGTAAAEPLLRQVLELDARHSAARYVLGCHLLERGAADEGEDLLWSLVEDPDEGLLPNACEALATHFRATGQTENLQTARQHLDHHAAAVAASRKERGTVTASDTFLDHGLTESELSGLQTALEAVPDLGSAWLVRKSLHYFPRQPLFVLCVTARRSGWFGSAENDQACASRLINKTPLPGRVLVIAPRGGFRSLGRKIMRMPGSQIFEKGT